MKSNLGTNIIRKISNDSNPYFLSLSEDLLNKRGGGSKDHHHDLLPKMLQWIVAKKVRKIMNAW